jgi:hypothetical protein
LAQLREVLPELFYTKLCQTGAENSFDGEATANHALWRGSAAVELGKGSFAPSFPP